MNGIKFEKLITIIGYLLLIAGFIMFVSQLKEGTSLIQFGFIFAVAGLGTIIIAYEMLVRKLKSENHKLHKEITKIKEHIIIEE